MSPRIATERTQSRSRGEVASYKGHAVLPGRRPDAGEEPLEIGAGRGCDPDDGVSGDATHGRDVAHVRDDDLPPGIERRSDREVEVDTLDRDVGGEQRRPVAGSRTAASSPTCTSPAPAPLSRVARKWRGTRIAAGHCGLPLECSPTIRTVVEARLEAGPRKMARADFCESGRGAYHRGDASYRVLPGQVSGREDPMRKDCWRTCLRRAHRKLLDWVDEVAALTQPDRVEWCDGSAEEYDRLCQLLVDQGTFTRLSDAKRPNSYWAHSDVRDVARVEGRTYVCSRQGGGRRPHQQLDRPARAARHPDRPLRRLHARAERCTSCRSRWARSARPSPTSASRSPTRPTWRSACGS